MVSEVSVMTPVTCLLLVHPLLFVGLYPNSIKVFNLETNTQIELNGSSNNNNVVSGSGGAAGAISGGHSAKVTTMIAWQAHLVSGSVDGRLCLWNFNVAVQNTPAYGSLAFTTSLSQYLGTDASVTTICDILGEDGNTYLLVGDHLGNISIAAQNAEFIYNYGSAHRQAVTSIVVLPLVNDSNVGLNGIFASSGDECIKIWQFFGRQIDPQSSIDITALNLAICLRSSKLGHGAINNNNNGNNNLRSEVLALATNNNRLIASILEGGVNEIRMWTIDRQTLIDQGAIHHQLSIGNINNVNIMYNNAGGGGGVAGAAAVAGAEQAIHLLRFLHVSSDNSCCWFTGATNNGLLRFYSYQI